MRSIVLNVISHSEETMNGSSFYRYRMKLLSNGRVFTTDGFTPDPNTYIMNGDVIEDMVIVARLTDEEFQEATKEAAMIENEYIKQCNEKRALSNEKCSFVHEICEKVTEISNNVLKNEFNVRNNGQLCLF